MTPLTPKQKACLDAIRALSAGGVSPSYDNLAAHLGLRSRSAAHRTVQQMIARGAVARTRGSYRSLRIVEADAPCSAAAAGRVTPLTHPQKRCLDAIRTLTVDGVSPSFDDLRRHLGISSRSGVAYIVKGLVDRGRLRHAPGSRRCLEVVETGDDPYSSDALHGLSTHLIKRVFARCHLILQERRA